MADSGEQLLVLGHRAELVMKTPVPKSDVHASFAGFLRWLKSVRHLDLRKVKICVSVRTNLTARPG